MKKYFKGKRQVWRLAVLLTLALTLCAPKILAEGYVRIHPTDASYGISNWGGSVMSPSSAQVEFFLGGVPAPNSLGSPITPIAVTDVSGFKQYEFSERGTAYVRAWDGPARTQKSYYGFTAQGYNIDEGDAAGAMNLPAPPTPAYHFKMKGFKTDYLADIPRAPEVGAIGESMQRSGDDYILTLTVGINYSEGSPKIQTAGHSSNDNKKYRLKVWIGDVEPDGSTLDGKWVIATDGSVTLTGEDYPPGTYHFKAQAWNWFGEGPWGPQKDYTTLSGGPGGGPDSASYNLIKLDAGLGVNTFPIAYTQVTSPSITTIKDLVEAINAQAEEPIVTAIGWWNPDTQQPQGYIINIDFDAGTITGFEGTKDLPAPEEVVLEKDKVYQVSVLKNATFDITGLRVD